MPGRGSVTHGALSVVHVEGGFPHLRAARLAGRRGRLGGCHGVADEGRLKSRRDHAGGGIEPRFTPGSIPGAHGDHDELAGCRRRRELHGRRLPRHQDRDAQALARLDTLEATLDDRGRLVEDQTFTGHVRHLHDLHGVTPASIVLEGETARAALGARRSHAHRPDRIPGLKNRVLGEDDRGGEERGKDQGHENSVSAMPMQG